MWTHQVVICQVSISRLKWVEVILREWVQCAQWSTDSWRNTSRPMASLDAKLLTWALAMIRFTLIYASRTIYHWDMLRLTSCVLSAPRQDWSSQRRLCLKRLLWTPSWMILWSVIVPVLSLRWLRMDLLNCRHLPGLHVQFQYNQVNKIINN